MPLYYYVLHLYVIHLSSRLFYLIVYGEAHSSLAGAFSGNVPEWYGHPLWVVYLAWVLIVLALYPPCAWYAEVKQRSRSTLLSYL